MALDLRRQDEDYQQLYSQVVQSIADRLYDAEERCLKGLSSRYPRGKEAWEVLFVDLPTEWLEDNWHEEY